jgi:hypothetical protein
MMTFPISGKIIQMFQTTKQFLSFKFDSGVATYGVNWWIGEQSW